MNRAPLAFLILLAGCSTLSNHSDNHQQDLVFKLAVDKDQIRQHQVRVEISVPKSVTTFISPEHYGGGPPLMKYLSSLFATDQKGNLLSVVVDKNRIKVTPSETSTYKLSYTLSVPQTVPNEIFGSLPTLNESYGRFDNNNTFLKPEGTDDQPARLQLSVPKNWPIATGWGSGTRIDIPKVSQLISGMIVLGDYRYSVVQTGTMKLTFATQGDFSDSDLKEKFLKVFQAQQDIAGPLPFQQLLVVLQSAKIAEPHGTSLTNAFVVDLPPGEKFSPFNFRLMGTIGHELFHQWDIYSVFPANEDGVYILTEGFANYFGVASLVRAKLMSDFEFAKFLNNYRTWLEENPNYPDADYDAIQSGFSKNIESLRDLAYTKGLLVAVLLDISLREDTQGSASLGSWFRALIVHYGKGRGYTIGNLRDLIIEVTGKPNGQAVKVFDSSFIGGGALDLNKLFNQLGLKRLSKKECSFISSSDAKAKLRRKVFAAEP